MIKRTQLTSNVDWLADCTSGDSYHMHLSQYLIRGREGNILIDASSNDEGDTRRIITEATDGEGIDALIFSHSILPHTRNYNSIQQQWGQIETVLSASNKPELQGMLNAQSKVLNATTDVCGQQFRFIDPILTDVVNSTWIYDIDNKFLFTAEGVGHYHRKDECTWTFAEFECGIPFDYVHEFHQDKLPFLRFVDPDKLRQAFEHVFSEFDVRYIAPIHGNPVHREHLDEYIEIVLKSVERFSTSYSQVGSDD